MSDATIVIVVSSVQTLALAILAAMVKIWGDKQALLHKDIVDTKVTIAELEKNTNSMKDALVKVTGEAAFAKGVKQGTVEEQARINVGEIVKKEEITAVKIADISPDAAKKLSDIVPPTKKG